MVAAVGAVNVVPAFVMLEPTAGAPGAAEVGDIDGVGLALVAEAEGLALVAGAEGLEAVAAVDAEVAAAVGTVAMLGAVATGFGDDLHAETARTGTANSSAPLRIIFTIGVLPPRAARQSTPARGRA